MIKWLRKSTSGMVVVTILRLYLGIEWTLDGFEKLTKGFDASGFIMGALKNPVMNSTGHPAYPWFTSFLKSAVKPHIGVFNFIVPWGELLVGLGILFGTLTLTAAFFGVIMNLCYLFAGTVSVNPLYLILEFIILAAGLNASKIGLDRWIIPWMRSKWPWLKRSVL
ncbi:Crp/Fnr family transcriptional regulator [Secundilactobacillus paracollinoides]|uniref:Crp/Fnr family transcriptional regulator n=1 Tax=Secundilactobacillus paracollinoides TaxID=240427 RepID=A0A1B2IXB2_9LACO|nr:DoxX family protein [Secundilactobacillus paracollinoides]ANZ60803.1 Crp/Fnr family transcriptional regulator [Secundilactobacillus paracollinoides]ANZ65176.1 Crp/Fnr family transcriptional regulator [Secundilactobacillus paracollinoides]ANZ66648.1 Crp/Fnr family transcriptional regulator [Secundilactobacillus paracollinoides]KRL79910.1 DoxX family protein [Secundilactobacillus paracollinoides DSM 15502 = JCM 11969]